MTTPEMNERLSALMDGELAAAEVGAVLAALRREPQLLARWRRYQLAAAALRNELGGAVDVTVLEAVHRRIEREPIPLPVRRRPGWRRWATGLALAASVAAVTVLGLDWWGARGGSAGEPVAQAGATRWENGLSPESEGALNAYLVEHGEYTPASGMNGLASYARFVSYDGR